MRTIPRESSEFEKKFHEQVALLIVACRNYDEGFECASLNIAVCLRTLFHDSKTSKSALSHINKKNIEMLDSSIYTGDDLNLGLLLKQFSTPFKEKYTIPDTKNHRMWYIPFCHSIPSFEIWESAKKRWLSIEDWLKQDICSNKNVPEAKLNRYDFIKMTANRDGGAHIDESVDVRYNYFRFSDSGLNKMDIEHWQEKPIMNIPIYPILRQIAFEVLFSFRNAGLIKKDINLIWKEDFKSLKAHLKALPLQDEYWLTMAQRMRLPSPIELNPDNKNDEIDDRDEFEVGTIKM